MYVCIYVSVHVCMYVCMHASLCASLRITVYSYNVANTTYKIDDTYLHLISMYIHIHTHIYKSIFPMCLRMKVVHAYIYWLVLIRRDASHPHIFRHMYIYIYIPICLCVCAYICIYTSAHVC